MHPGSIAATATHLVIASEYPPRRIGAVERRDSLTPLALLVDRRSGETREVRKPNAAMAYDDMRVAVDGNAVAHLVWQERAGETHADTTGGRGATQLWTSRIVDGRATPPELLLAEHSAYWGSGRGGSMRADRFGRVHVVLLAGVSSKGIEVLHLRYERAQWILTRRPVPVRLYPVELSFDSDNDTLHLVFTGHSSDRTNDIQDVWYARIGAAGGASAIPTKVSDPRSGQPRSPQVVVAHGGLVYVAWMQSRDSIPMFADSLRLVTVHRLPDGEHVSTTTARGEPDMHTIRAIWLDACGSVHLEVSSGSPGSPHRARTMSWDGHRWSIDSTHIHPYLFIGRTAVWPGEGARLTQIFSSAFVAPNLPIMLFWFESHRRTGLPPR